MTKEPTKFFVAMKKGAITGKLVCVPVYDPVTCNDFYAYTSRAWAEKHAAKNGAQVYSVQSFDCTVECNDSWLVKANMAEKHQSIADAAEKMFNP